MHPLARTLVLSLSLLTAGAIAHADGNPPPPKGAALIHGLTGAWRGQGTFAADGQKSPLVLDWRCEKTSGDWGVSCAMNMTGVPGMARYLETDLFGYDAANQTYHWYSVTNAGEVHDHTAKIKDPMHVTFQHDGIVDGKPYVETIQLDCKNPRELAVRAVTKHGDKVLNVLSGTLRKE